LQGSSGHPDREYINSNARLVEVCNRIRQAGRFAFDTEFVMEDRFVPEVCVVQLATDSLVAVADALEIDDLSPVWSLVSDPDVEVIVHAGMEDLGLCFAQGGQTPARVFDCQIGSGLVTTSYPLSLSRMLWELLQVRLTKTQTLTDWRRRPLTPEQIEYAAEDVVHLVEAREILGRRLIELGRGEWMEEEMSRFSEAATYERDVTGNAIKLKGARSLDPKGLAVAKELVKAREALAAKYNRPVRAVIRDHLLVEIARHRWKKASQIKTLRGLNLRAEGIRALAAAVEQACKSPRESWPVARPPDDETAAEASLSLLTRAVVRAYCDEHSIGFQLVTSKQDSRAFVRSIVRGVQPDPPSLLERGWRARTMGALIRSLLTGEAAIRVVPGTNGPSVTVK